MRIGVLGGIGPEATGQFYLKLIKKLQSSGRIKENGDFPQIVVNSVPAPELIGEVTDEQLEDYIRGIRELDEFDLDLIVMVCNTIHLFHERLQKDVATEILDLREEVKKHLIEKGMKQVSIIGTSSTVAEGLYEFPGIRYINPCEKELKVLGEAICKFNKGFQKQEQIASAMMVVDRCMCAGSECMVLACTEFAVMLADEEFPKLNTVDILVDAVVKRL
ncbi:aspartate/glutamate racemase family protein [Nanoarchaeota archaeon]